MSTPLAIETVMTSTPHTIGVDQPLSQAHRMMNQHQIRHLPVLEGGQIVGVVTHRDLALIETLPGVDPEEVTVAQAMTPEPFIVKPSAKVAQVARIMAQRKYGCCVVAERGRVIGIFTTVDALTILADLLDSSARRARARARARRPASA